MKKTKFKLSQTKQIVLAIFLGTIMGISLCSIKNSLTPPKIVIKEVEVEKEVYIEKKVIQKHLTRMDINDKLIQSNFLIANYCLMFPNKIDIIKTIVEISLEKKIPVNIAVALAIRESNLNPNAVNDTDMGLFQLNKIYFPKVKYFVIRDNTIVALSYLKELFNKTGNWNYAITFYNCGVENSRVPLKSMVHLAAVLEEERKIDILFNERMLLWKM